MASESKGIASQLKDKMGGTLDSLLSLPDKPEHPTTKKVARIFADIVVIMLGVTIFCVLTQWNIFGGVSSDFLARIANPSLTTLMAMPLSFAVIGAGCSWLLEDILGKTMYRTAGRIMSIIMPIAIAGAAACFIGAGFHSGITPFSMGSCWFVGLLIIPLSFFAIDRCIKKLQQKEAVFLRRAAPSINYKFQDVPSIEAKKEAKRVDQSQEHSLNMRNRQRKRALYSTMSDSEEMSIVVD